MPIEVADDFRRPRRTASGRLWHTELSPLVSVNIPPTRSQTKPGDGLREGTVGKPIEHVFARTVSIDDDTPLPPGQVGLLEIRGPNVMKGYYQRPDLTKEVMHGEWYRTGDMASCIPDGFKSRSQVD